MAKKPLTYENALARATNLCARAEHCRFEITSKLRQWGVGEQDAAKILDWLEDGGFINEERFALSFTHDKYRFEGWGRTKIRYTLRRYGIGDVAVQAAFQEIDENEYTAILRTLLETKARHSAETDPYKKKASLFRYAMSRGYESALISKIVSGLVSGADDFEVEEE